MHRALERAGNRLKGRAGVLRETLRNVHPVEAAAVAGPVLIADAGLDADQLLDGAFEDVVLRYRTWADEAVDESLGIAAGLVGEWRTGVPEAMKATLAGHLDDSAKYLEDALGGMAVQQLFDPKAVLFRTGPDLVPTGFVRHVTAIAGGATDISSSGYAFVALRSNGNPVGGIATGPVITQGLRDHGVTVEAYRWVYGPARRMEPFRPHLALDGKVFQKFDDPILANHHSFPPFAFYIPGDHAHCRCDFEPIMLTRDQAKALGFDVPTEPEPAPPPEPVKPQVERKPLSALGRQVKGLAKVGDAVKQAAKNSVRVNEFGFDGPDIERMAVGVRRVKLRGKGLPEGDYTELRFKLTDEGSSAWRRRMIDEAGRADVQAGQDWLRTEQRYLNQSVTLPLSGDDFDQWGRDRAVQWERHGWKGEKGYSFPAHDLNGYKAPDVDLDNPFVGRNGEQLHLNGTSTFRRTLDVDGRTVHVEYVDAANSGGSFAMRNQVRVFVEGAPVDENLFARVMDELGMVREVRYPAPADVRRYAEDGLLTRLGKKRPYKMSPKERKDELARIAREYGVTPKDVVIRQGPNGQVALELTDEATQLLVDQTGTTWFNHSLSGVYEDPSAGGMDQASYDNLLRVLSSGEDGLASTTRRFNDGVGGMGMSSRTDIETGGADYVFTSQQKHLDYDMTRARTGSLPVRNSVLKRLDWYSYDGDKYGVVSDALESSYGANYGTSNFVSNLTQHGETMFRGVISWDDVEFIPVPDERTKSQLLADLKKRGITRLGSRPADEVIRHRYDLGPTPQPYYVPGGGTLAKAGARGATAGTTAGSTAEQLGLSASSWGDGSNGAKLLQHVFSTLEGDSASLYGTHVKLGVAGADQYVAKNLNLTWGKLLKVYSDHYEDWPVVADYLAALYEAEGAAAKGATIWLGSPIWDYVAVTQKSLRTVLEGLELVPVEGSKLTWASFAEAGKTPKAMADHVSAMISEVPDSKWDQPIHLGLAHADAIVKDIGLTWGDVALFDDVDRAGVGFDLADLYELIDLILNPVAGSPQTTFKGVKLSEALDDVRASLKVYRDKAANLF